MTLRSFRARERLYIDLRDYIQNFYPVGVNIFAVPQLLYYDFTYNDFNHNQHGGLDECETELKISRGIVNPALNPADFFLLICYRTIFMYPNEYVQISNDVEFAVVGDGDFLDFCRMSRRIWDIYQNEVKYILSDETVRREFVLERVMDDTFKSAKATIKSNGNDNVLKIPEFLV